MPNVQNLAAFSLPHDFRGRPGWFVQLWWLTQALLFAPSPQFMYGWRRWLLRLFGATIGKNVLIRPSARITFPWKLTIKDYAWVGDEVTLYNLGPIEIGSHAVVSQRSYLCTGSHECSQPEFPIWALPVVVEDEAWLATDVFVSPGITIGRGAVVGARSSVFHDIPPMMICVGSPAKPIKPRLLSQPARS